MGFRKRITALAADGKKIIPELLDILLVNAALHTYKVQRYRGFRRERHGGDLIVAGERLGPQADCRTIAHQIHICDNSIRSVDAMEGDAKPSANVFQHLLLSRILEAGNHGAVLKVVKRQGGEARARIVQRHQTHWRSQIKGQVYRFSCWGSSVRMQSSARSTVRLCKLDRQSYPASVTKATSISVWISKYFRIS